MLRNPKSLKARALKPREQFSNSFRQLDDNTTAFTHLPSPQGVCHSAFFAQLQSLDSNEQAARWEKPMQFALDRAEGRSQLYNNYGYSAFTTTLHSFEARACRCTIRTDKQIASFWPHRLCLYNLLPLHHTLVHHSTLDNSLCTTCLRTVCANSL